MPQQKPLLLAPGVIAGGGGTPEIAKHLAQQQAILSLSKATSSSASTSTSRLGEESVQAPFDHIYPIALTLPKEESKSDLKEVRLGAPWPFQEDGGMPKNMKQSERITLQRLRQFTSWSAGMQYAGTALLLLVCALVVASIFWHFVWSAIVDQHPDAMATSAVGTSAGPSSMHFLSDSTTKVAKRIHPDTSMRIFNATRDVFRVNESSHMLNATPEEKIVRPGASISGAFSSSTFQLSSDGNNTNGSVGPSVSILQLQELSQQLSRTSQHALHKEDLLPSDSEVQRMPLVDSTEAIPQNIRPQRAALHDHPGLLMARAFLDMVPSWIPKRSAALPEVLVMTRASAVDDPHPSTQKVRSERQMPSSRKAQGLLAPRDFPQ